MATTSTNVAAAWRKRADWLAHWAKAQLVNRTDLWIRYLPTDKRLAQPDGTPSLTRLAPLPAKRGKLRLSERILARHFRGEKPGNILGIHSLGQNNTAKWIAIQLHRGNDPSSIEMNNRAAHHWHDDLRSLGFRPLLIDSDGQGEYCLIVVFRQAVPAPLARHFAGAFVRDYTKLGLQQPPTILPAGDQFDENDWLCLPGCHPVNGQWSRVWKLRRWVEGADAVEALLHAHGDSPALIRKLGVPATLLSMDGQAVPPIPLRESAGHLNAVAVTPTKVPKSRKKLPDRGELERQVLCYLLASTRSGDEATAFAALYAAEAGPDAFTQPVHRDIFQAMQKLHAAGERITPSFIGEQIPEDRRRAALDVLDELILQKPPAFDSFDESLPTLARPEPTPTLAQPITVHVETQNPPAPPSQTSPDGQDLELQFLVKAWPTLAPSVRRALVTLAIGSRTSEPSKAS